MMSPEMDKDSPARCKVFRAINPEYLPVQEHEEEEITHECQHSEQLSTFRLLHLTMYAETLHPHAFGQKN